MKISVISHNMPDGTKELSINVQGMTCEESDAIHHTAGVTSGNTVEAQGIRLSVDQKIAINKFLASIWYKTAAQAT